MISLKNKTVILGVTGSIAAYKIANIASSLTKQGCEVHVIMTLNATKIIAPITFSTLTGNNCLVDTFDERTNYNVTHVALAKKADLLFIAPASANIIGKLSHGIADDMLTTTALACTCPKYIAPAMNTNMFNNPIVKENIKTLSRFGYKIISPETGMLACKDIGEGKLANENVLLDAIYRTLSMPKDLINKNILVTAGPTQEAIDPVRYITNHSSGKMGYALAEICLLRGANVTLVSGPTNLIPPLGVNFIPIVSAKDMYEAVVACAPKMDIIIKAAAVADYTPAKFHPEKIKKNGKNLSDLSLIKTSDILKYLGENKKEHQFICGFSMETEKLLENSRKKLLSKNVDIIVANDLSCEGAGFSGDTNIVTLITKGKSIQLPVMSKIQVAEKIIDTIIEEIKK